MFLQLEGLLGQGDIHEQREIITTLSQNPYTKLCIVIEPTDHYGIQDDTAVDLSLHFQKINLAECFGNIKEWSEDIIEEIMTPIAKEVFQMNGLVVIDCRLNKFLIDGLMKAFHEYYFQNVKHDARNKTHLIYILPSKGNR